MPCPTKEKKENPLVQVIMRIKEKKNRENWKRAEKDYGTDGLKEREHKGAVSVRKN